VAATAGKASHFDGSGSSSPVGTIATYKWDFGDGQSATTPTPSTRHVYAHAGSFTARLTVTNSAGTSLTQVFTGQTVSNQGGPQAATTRPVSIMAPTSTLSALKVSPKTFSFAGRRLNGRCVKPTPKNGSKPRCRRRVKLKISYTLNTASTVTFTLKRQSPGRKVNDRCVRPTHQNRKHHRCTRLTALAGRIIRTSTAGGNTFTFDGTIGGHRLGPGIYALTAKPNQGAARRVTFTLVE
jgi:hypothetical protein